MTQDTKSIREEQFASRQEAQKPRSAAGPSPADGILEVEDASCCPGGLDPDATAVEVHHPLCDGKTQPAAFTRRGAAFLPHVKAIEDPLFLTRPHAAAGIAYSHSNAELASPHSDGNPSACGRMIAFSMRFARHRSVS